MAVTVVMVLRWSAGSPAEPADRVPAVRVCGMRRLARAWIGRRLGVFVQRVPAVLLFGGTRLALTLLALLAGGYLAPTYMESSPT
jgi:hypothetical protein